MVKLGYFKHCLIIFISLFVIIGVPMLIYKDEIVQDDGGEVIAQASVVLPDQPSGDFVIFINKSHSNNIDNWKAFFTGADVVIFDDISCLVAKNDAQGLQMAQRYQAELPENQMKLKTIDATLLASKVEAGYIDVAIFSKEMADALKLASQENLIDIVRIEIKGANNA